jgi:hypothetical protein
MVINLVREKFLKIKHGGKVRSTFTVVVRNPKGTKWLRRIGTEEGTVLKWL